MSKTATSDSLNIDVTSSIGVAWPPTIASHERLKGFYPEVITSQSQLNDFSAEINAHATVMSELALTRLSVRFIGSKAMIGLASEMGIHVEAALPFRYSRDRHMAYVSVNAPSRQMTDLEVHTTLIAQSSKKAAEPPKIIMDEPGLVPVIYNGSDPPAHDRRTMVQNLAELYDVFGYDEGDVVRLLHNPNILLAYIQNPKGRIISTALAEKAIVSVRKGLISEKYSLVEITEAITDPAHRGLGLYRKVSKALSIALDDKVIDPLPQIIYGESNLSSPGVIIAARENGRDFATDNTNLYLSQPQPGFGILAQNYKVLGTGGDCQYNDFAVTYLPERR